MTEDGWTVGGMAKGAGMLAPGLATMLVVITTDADARRRPSSTSALRAATRVTFDRLDSDGCMSTNDTGRRCWRRARCGVDARASTTSRRP